MPVTSSSVPYGTCVTTIPRSLGDCLTFARAAVTRTVPVCAGAAADAKTIASTITINLDKIDVHLSRDQLLLGRLAKKSLQRGPPARAVIECQLVHVHADKPIGVARVQPAAELLRVRHGF